MICRITAVVDLASTPPLLPLLFSPVTSISLPNCPYRKSKKVTSSANKECYLFYSSFILFLSRCTDLDVLEYSVVFKSRSPRLAPF